MTKTVMMTTPTTAPIRNDSHEGITSELSLSSSSGVGPKPLEKLVFVEEFNYDYLPCSTSKVSVSL